MVVMTFPNFWRLLLCVVIPWIWSQGGRIEVVVAWNSNSNAAPPLRYRQSGQLSNARDMIMQLQTAHGDHHESSSSSSASQEMERFTSSSTISSRRRRHVLNYAVNLPAMMLAVVGSTTVPGGAATANAAAPVTAKDTDSFGARLQRATRQKPPKLLRRKLKLDFAVLLMRSSYQALDQIDCVAMDQFQRDFFMIRQSEYQPYIDLLGPGLVQQGDLTDPYYFDFISFSQYATINRDITQDPPMVFQEQQGIDQGEDEPMKFVPVVIKRDPSLTNKLLIPEHDRRVGSMILDRLEEIYGTTDIAIPKIAPNSRPDAGLLLSSLKQMVNLFLVNGYAFDGSVARVESSSGPTSSSGDASGTQYRIVMNGPATLWGGRALQQQGAVLLNDFVLKTAKELVQRAGYRVVSPSIQYPSGTVTEEILFTVR